jgi:crotonobetainyl-CoA:carnitine CoA-transferase CaiB-like acyl-CoA transferase
VLSTSAAPAAPTRTPAAPTRPPAAGPAGADPGTAHLGTGDLDTGDPVTGDPGTAGCGTALRLAAAHLRAAGCAVTATPTGLAVAHGPHRAGCEVGWAGPVRLPLANEADVQAACGIAHVHGRRFGAPTALGVDFASVTAGLLAAQGVLAALIGAARGTAAVRRVGTSAAQAALLAVGQYVAAATADEPWAEPSGPGGPPFTSADGMRFEVEALHPEPWLAFWTACGVPSRVAGEGWGVFQARYGTACCPLPAALFDVCAALPWPRLAALAAGAGLDLTPLAPPPPPPPPPAEVEAGAGAGTGADADPGAVGHADVLPPPWDIQASGPAEGPAGSLAEGHDAPATGTGPLAGILVVEVARRVQGPLAGHVLRMLGADVVRVEPAGGDPLRGVPPMAGECSARFTALNHSKRMVEADLRAPAGRAAVHALAARADVLLHSLAPGKDAAAGLDADTLARVRPGLVHARASGWGSARGPRPPVGTDFPVQAWSGLAALLTPPGAPPAPSLMTVTDVLGGLVCAEGVLAALLARARDGRGRRVETSLLGAARLLAATGRPGPGPRDGLTPGVEPYDDLAALAADPRFAGALTRAPGCTLIRAPWTFR